MSLIYRVFENERHLFVQNSNSFVYNTIKACHDDLNINIVGLQKIIAPIFLLWVLYPQCQL